MRTEDSFSARLNPFHDNEFLSRKSKVESKNYTIEEPIPAFGKSGLDIVAKSSHMKIFFEKLRPVSDFLGNQEPIPFILPRTVGQCVIRTKTNLLIFKYNYLLFSVCVFVLSILTSPMSVLCLSLLGFGWYFGQQYLMSYLNEPSFRHKIFRVGNLSVSSNTIFFCFCATAMILMAFVLRIMLMWTVVISGFSIILHASFRDSSNIRDGMESDDDAFEGKFETKKTTKDNLMNI